MTRTVYALLGLLLSVYAMMADDDYSSELPWRCGFETNSVGAEVDYVAASAPPSLNLRDKDSRSQGNAADAISPEIQLLANGLALGESGPDASGPVQRIYDFVQKKIEYVHYFGCKKGAALTLLEGSGSDFDQCALLVALLRATGYHPSYQLGCQAIPYESATNEFDIRHWLRLSMTGSNFSNARQFVAALDRRFPFYDYNSAKKTIIWPRVWVVLNLSNVDYYLDPAFKPSIQAPGSNVAPAINLSKTNLLALAGGETSSNGVDWVRGLNEASVCASLVGCTSNLLSYLKTQCPAASPVEVLGGWYLSQTNAVGLGTGTRFPIVTNTTPGYFPVLSWEAIPICYLTTLEITGNLTASFTVAELQGRRLSLTFETPSGQTIPQGRLWLEDTLVASETNGTGATLKLTNRSICPAWSWDVPWDFANRQPAVYITNSDKGLIYQRNAPGYAFVYGFESSGRLLERRLRILDGYRHDGKAADSREVVTETLNVIGQRWLYQTDLNTRLVMGQRNMTYEAQIRAGRVAQEAGFYVDCRLMQMAAKSAATNNVYDLTNYYAACDAYALLQSAMEHGVLEQLQHIQSVSTVKSLQVANALSKKIFLITSNNLSWTTNQLNYPPYTVSGLWGQVKSAGYTVLLSEDGYMHVGDWHGFGYFARQAVGGNYGAGAILGVASGAYATYNTWVNSVPVLEQRQASPDLYNATPPTTPTQIGGDPVNMADGSFAHNHVDLSLGQPEPRGLSFARSHSSNRRDQNGASLGYGWTHNYDIRVCERSALEAGLGLTTPAEMAPYFVAAQAIMQLTTGATSAKEWAMAALVAKWGVDQLCSNGVSVILGNDTAQFIRQPDGTYTPPAGLTMRLSRDNGQYSVTQRHGHTFWFDASNRVSSIVDAWGLSNTFSYRNDGRLEKVTDAYSRTTGLHYNASNLVCVVSNSTGELVRFSYDSSNNLVSVADPEGKTNRMTYDGAHRITSVIDPLGHLVASNFYDDLSRVVEQHNQGDPAKASRMFYSGSCNVEQDPLGGQRWFFYDDSQRATSVQDANGHRTSLTYDGQNHIVQRISPAGDTNLYQYDANQNLVQTTDPLGKTTTYSYDADNHLVSVTDPLGHTNGFQYNAQHQVTRKTDALGHSTTFAYNGDGTLLSTTDPAQKTTSFTYDRSLLASRTPPGGATEYFTNDARGNMIAHRDARGNVTAFAYNLRRQLSATVGPDGATVGSSYDDAGNLATATDPRSNTTTYSYSATQQRLTTTLPATAAGVPVVRLAYDERDWPVRSTNALGRTSTLAYDAAQRLLSTTDPLSRSASFTYDASGRRLSASDGLGLTSRTSYNRRGETTAATDPGSNVVSFAYDAAGNRTALTNRLGNAFTFTYDANNRPISTSTPGGRSTTRAYDERGWLASLTAQPSGRQTTYQYDDQGRLTRQADSAGTNVMTYDANGNLASRSEGGLTQTWACDANNRVTNYTDGAGHTLSYGYDLAGNLTRLTYPGNKSVTYAYDSHNRLTTVTDWAQRTTSFAYDLEGHVTLITRPNQTRREMSYDAAGQVTNIVERNGWGLVVALFRLDWDAGGRIAREFIAPLGHAYTEPARAATNDVDNRLTLFNGQSVTHDDDGNMTSGPLTNDTRVTYTYDARNRLTAGGGLTYSYDPSGQRTALADGTNVTRFVVNPNAVPSQVLVRERNLVTNYYVYGLGLLYEVTVGTNGAEIAVTTYHFDYRGSTVALTGSDGLVRGRFEYSLYGGPLLSDGDQ